MTEVETAVTRIEPSDEFISNFKSVYYLLNASPDSQMQVFNENRIIKMEDILELNDKINSKLNIHNIIANSLSVYISFNNGKSKSYENWNEFTRSSWTIPDTTKTFNIHYDFFVKLPYYEAPQRHSLKIRIGSNLRPDEYFKILLESDNDSEVDSLLANVVCKVDFVNSVICDELINLVRDWYQTLQKDYSRSKIERLYSKHANIISKYIDTIFPLIALFIIYGATSEYINRVDLNNYNFKTVLQDLLLWFVISSTTFYLFRFIGYTLASINYKRAKSFNDYSYLFITKGDFNKRDEIEQKNKSIVKQISINISASLLFALISFLWGIMMR